MEVLRLPCVRPGRVPLAARTLLRDRLRLVISVGGIGFAILLVLLLDGLRVGTVAKSTTYIDHVAADVFVAQEGVENMALAASGLSESVEIELLDVAGVAEASGILRIPFILEVNETKHPITLIAYDPDGLGGPWDLRSGRVVERADEVVLDDVLAGELSLRPGDAFELAGRSFVVVGTSGQTANIAGKHVFASRETVQSLLGLEGRVNFVLVQVVLGATPEAVAAALNGKVPGITATTRDTLSENDRELLGGLFLAPIAVASTVGLLVGLAIIGLTMYTTTVERIRDFGVLKAMGAPSSFLLRTVVSQAAALGLTGFLVGLAGTYLAEPVIVSFVPDIGVIIQPGSAIRTLAAVLVMSLLGSLVPVIRIMRVDPLMVFRT